MIEFLYCISLAAVCAGCGVSEFDSAGALDEYVLAPGNDLIKEAESNGYVVRVSYRPTDLLVHQEVTGDHFDVSIVDSLRKKYSRYYYFIVSLSKDSKEAIHQSIGLDKYSHLVETLSFRMRDYVTLTTSATDTIPVGDFMLNRTYGLNRSTDLLFVFSGEKLKGKKWIQLNLNEFGLGMGNQRFRFLCADLDRPLRIDFGKAETVFFNSQR